MATAQVEAWVGARKGSIHEAARSIDASLADAALGRMMLHRRRAVAASVISEFFARGRERIRSLFGGPRLRGAAGSCGRAGNCGKGGRARRQSLRYAAAAGV